MNNTESKQNNILLEEQKEIDRHKITADQMPKVNIQFAEANVAPEIVVCTRFCR